MRLPGATFYRRNPLSNKHAETLYDLWKKVGSGDSKLASDVRNSRHINDLVTDGYIRINSYGSVEFMKRGQDAIRNIILGGEQSALDKNQQPIDYDAIFHKSFASGNKKKKVAHVVCNVANSNRENWFQSILRQK